MAFTDGKTIADIRAYAEILWGPITDSILTLQAVQAGVLSAQVQSLSALSQTELSFLLLWLESQAFPPTIAK